MNKGKVLLATSALLLSAGVLAACSGGKSGSSGDQTLAMSIPRIQILSTIRFLIKIDFRVYRKCDRWLVGSGQVWEFDSIAC